jgi:hypothetical protein
MKQLDVGKVLFMGGKSMQADARAIFGNWRRDVRQITYGTELAAYWDPYVRADTVRNKITRKRASDRSTTSMTETIEIPLARRKYNQWGANETLEDYALHKSTTFGAWLNFGGQDAANDQGFNMLLFGAAAAVIFPVIAQNGSRTP